MKKFLVLIALCFGAVGQLMAANVLVVGINATASFTPYTTLAVNDIGDTLSASGHSVTKLVLTGATTGQIATALSGASYDQVFFLDMADQLLLNAADTAAIASFWNAHRGLVVDGRSYGYAFQPTEPSGQALIRNVANAFALTGGGVQRFACDVLVQGAVQHQTPGDTGDTDQVGSVSNIHFFAAPRPRGPMWIMCSRQ